MKITKYLVICLLLITIGKKTLLTSEINPDGTITGPPMRVSGGWVTDREGYGQIKIPSSNKAPKHRSKKKKFTVQLQNSENIIGIYNTQKNSAKIKFTNVITTSQAVTPPNIDNPDYVMIGTMPNPKKYPGTRNNYGGQSEQVTLWGIPAESKALVSQGLTPSSVRTTSRIKKYTPVNRTAIMNNGSIYVGVIEYSQAVTPPNVTIPALQAFAEIKNQSASSKSTYGGQSKTTTLWGLKVTGHKVAIKSTNKNQTIGYFWPESNIAQLDNGQTLVGTMLEQQGNYKKHGAYATGPAWTRYSEQQLETLKVAYKATPSATNMISIGMVKVDGQKYSIRGITLALLPSTTKTNTKLSSRPLTLMGHHQNQPITSNEEAEDEKSFSESSHQMSSSQAVGALYNINR